MLSFNNGLSGLQQFQKQMDVIGNNIANVNTTAYRSARVEFTDSFSNTLREATTSSTGVSTAAMEVGTGVQTSAIASNFSKNGSISSTSYDTDMAIDGSGFFMVRDVDSGETFATRDGAFKIDSSGYLVTSSGMRVQGYSDSTLTTLGDIKIDNTKDGTTPLAYTDPPNNTIAATMDSYSFGKDGTIQVTVKGDTTATYVRGQILLQNFTNPQALTKEGNNLYSGIAKAGPLGGASPQSEAPTSNGLGSLVSSSLESSNVDLSLEMTNMITAQRAFQASSKIITTSDEIMQEVVNLKR
jgi:flagellar hook protein FlgE